MMSLNQALRATNNLSRIITNSLKPNHIQFQPVMGVKTLEEKVGLPPRPKKPLTPFFRYMNEIRPVLISENPDLKLPEIVKLISKKWETVESSVKEKLQQQYQKEKITYVESRALYDSKITDEKRTEMQHLKQEIIAQKEKRMTKKRIAELDRPKKPPSAFLLFIAKERKLTPQSPNQTYRDWHSKITAKWSRLSDGEKEEYLKVFREKLAQYKQDLAQWEEKMVRLGNIDLVRPDLLIETPPKPKSKSSK